MAQDDCLFPGRAYLEPMTVHFPFQNTYAALPASFFARVAPTPVAAPRLIKLNRPLAVHLGLDPDLLDSPEGAEILAGKRVPDGADPIAMAYAGHQFGHFVPQLGDGRAILLGEVIDADGVRRDIQLKGSGPTPFSRRGDGRAALGPVLREYIVSEAMAALGIPTTRSLAAVMTGENVMRETPLPGAVLTRVAASHIRVGTFQYFAARGDTEGVRRLADHVIARHYPQAADAERPYRALLEARDRAAGRSGRALAAGRLHPRRHEHRQYLDLGRDHRLRPLRLHGSLRPRHGVQLDRRAGPLCLRQPAADRAVEPDAAGGMPAAAVLGRPGQGDRGGADRRSAISRRQFTTAYQAGLRKKIGLFTARDGDEALVQDLLDAMAKNQADFTLTFRRLGDAALDPDGDTEVRQLFADPTAYDEWAARWRQRIADEPQAPAERQAAMRSVNPAFIPRNHRVEAVIEAAVNRDDFAPFEELLAVLAKPYRGPAGICRLCRSARAGAARAADVLRDVKR